MMTTPPENEATEPAVLRRLRGVPGGWAQDLDTVLAEMDAEGRLGEREHRGIAVVLLGLPLLVLPLLVTTLLLGNYAAGAVFNVGYETAEGTVTSVHEVVRATATGTVDTLETRPEVRAVIGGRTYDFHGPVSAQHTLEAGDPVEVEYKPGSVQPTIRLADAGNTVVDLGMLAGAVVFAYLTVKQLFRAAPHLHAIPLLVSIASRTRRTRWDRLAGVAS